MTTLADVNATLGATNIALSGVSKNQEETNKGINSFLDYLQDKDASDRRRQIESDREKKASVLQRTGSGVAAAGRGLLSAGRATGGFLSSLFDKIKLPFAVGASFLSGLLGAGLLKNAIRGIGVVFGDEIANFILGDKASKEIKEMVGGAISGAAIGSFFGPRFMLIGGLIGALSRDQKIKEQGKELYEKLNDLLKGFGGLSGIFKKITEGIGDGLEGINNLLKGNIDTDSVTSTLKLLAGAAFMISPKGSILLLKRALGVLLTNPAGLALLALTAGGAYLNQVMGNEITDAEGFLASLGIGVTGFLGYKAGKSMMDIGSLTTEGEPVNKKGGKKGGKVRKLTKGSLPNASSRNPLSRMLSTMVRGVAGGVAKMGLFTLGAATVMLPLAAIGLTEAYFGDQFREATDKRETDIRARKLLGGERLTGFEDFSGDKLGKSMLVPEGSITGRSLASYAKVRTDKEEEELSKLQRLMIKKGTNDLENFFKQKLEQRKLKEMDTVGNPTTVMNSGNTTNNISNSQGFAFSRDKTHDVSDPHAIRTGTTSGTGLF